jgi:general secretion pathway protein G
MSVLKRRVRSEEGFTLFELLIVIVILAILAGIVAFSVGTSGAGAATSSCQSDAKAFETALQEYNTDIGTYPGQVSATSGNENDGSLLTTVVTGSGGQSYGPFMRQVPSTAHYQIVTDGLGGVFVYPAASTGVPIPRSSSTMDRLSTTVSFVLPSVSPPDPSVMNFDTNPSICADPNVVQ